MLAVKDGLLVFKGTKRRRTAHEKENSMILTACHDHPLGKETTLCCNNECGTMLQIMQIVMQLACRGLSTTAVTKTVWTTIATTTYKYSNNK